MLKKILSVSLIIALLILCLPAVEISSARAETIGNTKGKEWKFIAAINKYRIENGLEAVTAFAPLQQAADIRAEEIDYCYSHTRPDGTPCYTVLYEVGVSAAGCGENLGRSIGCKTATKMLQGWIDSPGHNWNMLQECWGHLGIGHNMASDGKTNCWSLLLIGETGGMTGLSLEGAENLRVKAGTKLSSLDITVVETHCEYGRCACPLIDEMCTGYDRNKIGLQTVTVSHKGEKVSFEIEVVAESVKSISLNKKKAAITLKKGDEMGKTIQLTANVTPAAAAPNIEWVSSDESVATVDENGLVTSVGFGKCTITARATDGTGKKASCAVTVQKKQVTSIALKGKKTMKAGDTQNLIATIKPKKAFDQTLRWKSNKPDVVSVDENGVVTALKKGTATITCTARDGSKVKAKIKIKVK